MLKTGAEDVVFKMGGMKIDRVESINLESIQFEGVESENLWEFVVQQRAVRLHRRTRRLFRDFLKWTTSG